MLGTLGYRRLMVQHEPRHQWAEERGEYQRRDRSAITGCVDQLFSRDDEGGETHGESFAPICWLSDTNASSNDIAPAIVMSSLWDPVAITRPNAITTS